MIKHHFLSTLSLPHKYVDRLLLCMQCADAGPQASKSPRRRDPQKYTYSYHGNKCLKGNSRSVTKSDSRGPGKSQRVIKDT